ncbi:MAG: hypothetical protein RMM31_06330 [Anaerolineae bacterium]|nr:hypothetical protein [Anaerolineae bacterium]
MKRPSPRLFATLLFSLSALVLSAWADYDQLSRVDVLRDPISTLIIAVFGAVAGDTMMTLEDILRRRFKGLHRPLPSVLVMLASSALGAWFGYLFTPLGAMLAHTPFVGSGFLNTISLSIGFIASRMILPAALAGVIIAVLRSGYTLMLRPKSL